MLRDYAHERWAAGRPVAPELWRCVGPFAEGAALDDLARVLRQRGAGARGRGLPCRLPRRSPPAARSTEPDLRGSIEPAR